MREITIGKTVVAVKDYECAQDGDYIPKKEPRLWLYVNLTDACPAACPFCVHAPDGGTFDIKRFERTLRWVAPHIRGISLTGGEPMLDKGLVEDAVCVINKWVPRETEVDLVTNGVNIAALPELIGIGRFAVLHVSRHAADDTANRRLMRWPQAPSAAQIGEVFSALKDPGMTVLNCVLQAGGIHDLPSVIDYLEFAASLGAANVSFIGMFRANAFCGQNYVSPAAIPFESDARFHIWNRFCDHGYCSCSSGDYHAKAGWIRFYYRCPGDEPAPDYCRQLVYGADNRLRTGFGKESAEIKF